MLDPSSLTDDDLLEALHAANDPEQARLLRALAAQRGLYNASASIPPAVKQEISDRGGGA